MCRSAWGAALGVLAAVTGPALTGRAEAQVIVGTVVNAVSREAVAGVRLTLSDSSGAEVDGMHSRSNGVFLLDGKRLPGLQFRVHAGNVPSSVPLALPRYADTVYVELAVSPADAHAPTLRITGTSAPSFNERQLAMARRNGWQIIEPHQVAAERGAVRTLGDLLRRHPLLGVRPAEGSTGCYRYARNNRCLVLVVDGHVVGADMYVAPEDVYFVALLNAPQATVQYGPRARNGALFVATRRDGEP